MADSRPGGIEKIAHLFIAGSGAGSLRARDNSSLRWTGPAASPGNGNDHGVAAGNGDGHGQGGVRGLEPVHPPADSPPADPESATSGATGRSPATSGDTRGNDPSATSGATGRWPAAVEGASETAPTATSGATERHLAEPGASVGAPMAGAAAPSSQALGAMPSLLSRATVAAVLSGHMGPLAGPSAELFAKTLAREGTAVAMLYGPADFACLHRFTARPAEEALAADATGYGERHCDPDTPIDTTACDMLLLPDWVFQSDLWPLSRGVHSICLAYGAGSEGLMSAYGALKGLIARLGKPEELFLLPFGCNEQEETWTHERLGDMCRRFLDLEPRPSHEKPDMRVHASKLLPIDGGSEGVKQLFAAIGQPVLTLVPRRRELETDRKDTPERAAMPEKQLQAVALSADVTPLVAVSSVPCDGEAVLRALIESRQAGGGAFFDLWSRNGVAGTILGREGLIGAAGEVGDLLGFALWLCRQAKINELDELTSITIAVKSPDEWLLDAGQAMPVPVRWVRWRAFQLSGQLGLCFEPVKAG